jgi:hypothetical protein
MRDMKKTLVTASIILLLLLLLIAMVQSFTLANPSPYMLGDDVPPDTNTKPPSLLIESPQNNTVYCGKNVNFRFSGSIGESNTSDFRILYSVYYQADWQENKTYIYKYYGYLGETLEVNPQANLTTAGNPAILIGFSYETNLTEIPEGAHNITTYAYERGSYVQGLYAHTFYINSSSTLFFIIDRSIPKITNLSVENKTYTSTEISLSFNVNKANIQFSYCIDNQPNATILGNATLTGLSKGSHCLIVYANDTAGNTGKSDTVFFTVNTEPSPTSAISSSSSPTQQPTLELSPTANNIQAENFTPIIIILALVAIAVAVGILVYFKKIKKKKQTIE